MRGKIVWTAVIGFAVLVGGFLLLLRLQMRSGDAPRLYVPKRFKTLRDSPGHVSHIHDAKVKCDECHDLSEHGFEVPGLDLCNRCHPSQVSTIHAGSPLAASAVDCRSCHNFGNEPGVEPHNCIRCHAKPQSMARAIETHSEAKCDQCHRPHVRPSLQPRTCEECHEDRVGVRHARKAEGAQLCLDCHGVHDKATEADTRCRTCHSPRIPKTATFDGHDKCAGCHAPHDFSRRGARACETCHEKQVVLASQKVSKHRPCGRCHDEHAPGPKRARAECEKCHRRVEPKHPPDERGGDCLGCHPVHDLRRVAGSAVPCIVCHDEAASATAFHTAKTQCADCHRTHEFALNAKDSATCGRCHREQRRLTARARDGGHATCVECHATAAHAPEDKPRACASCHQQERATAPKGHDDCAKCHVSHSGDRIAKATCQSCHEEQRGDAHARAVKNGCLTCHRPHGPKGPEKPPACTDCHTPAKLPALHKVTDHQTCATCHEPHEQRPRSDRRTCSSARCHTTIQNKPAAQHEPTSKACSGCHVFRRGAGGGS